MSLGTKHSRSGKPKVVLGLASLASLAALSILTATIAPRIELPKAATVQPGYYRVVEVSDGDTFSVDMDGRTEKVRMIGVDTPETVKPNSPVECYGKAASDYTKKTLSTQNVRLEADPTNQNRDRYNRLLRYVYLSDDTLFNKKLIEEGYGFAYLSFPFTKADEFREAAKQAREQARGVWSGDCQITSPDSDRPKSNTIQ